MTTTRQILMDNFTEFEVLGYLSEQNIESKGDLYDTLIVDLASKYMGRISERSEIRRLTKEELLKKKNPIR
jgi:hypothetical protein